MVKWLEIDSGESGEALCWCWYRIIQTFTMSIILYEHTFYLSIWGLSENRKKIVDLYKGTNIILYSYINQQPSNKLLNFLDSRRIYLCKV